MMKRILCVVLTVAMVFGLIAFTPVHVHAASDMQASEQLLAIIKKMEGFTAIPKWDYAQWTVGFGTRCPDEHLQRYLAEGIPVEEANALFQQEISLFEEKVNSFMDKTGKKLTQGQFDALVSLTYNIGGACLTSSSYAIYQALINGATGNDLIAAMTMYCTAGGEFLPGLMRRRLVEAAMFLQSYYDDYPPDNYCYVLYDANGGKKDMTAQGYDCNLSAVPISQPTYEGYTFAGWYTSPTGGVRVTSLDESTHGMTLYAHWNKGSVDGDYTVEPVDGVRVKVTGDSVNIRSGPGTGYSIIGNVVRGNELVITGVAKVGSTLWGQFDRGWICLTYTNYEDVISSQNPAPKPDEPVQKPEIQLPIDATVLASGGITVYNGPHTSYPKRGTLQAGAKIQILEFMEFIGVQWARYSGGWVQVNSKLFLHDDAMLAHRFTTTTSTNLNIRSGPGMSSSIVGTAKKGTILEVMAVTMVDGTPWGRISSGWISLAEDHTDFDINKLPSYQNHSYDNWYITKEATCIDQGEERRDCTMCDHHETRQTALAPHQMGSWYESLEGTCISYAQERRDCDICDYHETRDTILGEHSFGDWYETQAPTCSEVGQQRCDCTLCDAYLTDEVPMIEHNFDAWYETKVPTAEEPGEARRNCKNCSYFETRVLEPTEHIFGEWFISVESTCIQQGEERRNCSHCDLFETRPMDLTDHSLGNWEIYTAPTCTEDGEERKTCIHCDHYESRAVDATGHTLGDWVIHKDATCTEMGEERRICANCDHYESRPIDMPDHQLGDWQTHLGATCTEDGEERRTCADCDYYESNVLPATGHSFDDWYTYQPPTITDQGEDRRECLQCDHYESRIIDKLAQTITKVYGTMSNSGSTYMNVRSGPGSEYDVIGRLKYGTSVEILEQKTVNGNVWGRTTVGWVWITGNITLETVSVEARDFTTRYFANVICKNLNLRTGPGSNYTVLDLLSTGDVVEVLELRTIGQQQWGRLKEGWILLTDLAALSTYVYAADSGHIHVYGDWFIHKDATCTENGQERRQCADCDHYETRVIEATDHSFGNWYTYKDATEFENGEERRDCTNCGHYESRVTEAIGHTHNFGKWFTHKDATCTEQGEARRVCDGCDHYETRIIDANGHSFGDWYIHKDASCTEQGEERRVCDGCDHYETRVIDANGHSFGDWYIYKDATEYENGEERRDCIDCGHYESRTIDAIGHTHSFGNWFTYTDATCTEMGEARRVCDGCDYYESRTIDANGHSFGDWYIYLEATVTAEGEERKDCANCAHYESRTIPVKAGQTITKVYGTMNNSAYTSIYVRSGPGSSYSTVGKLMYGTTVEILEQKTVSGVVWGRTTAGWVWITGHIELETVTVTASAFTEKIYANIICESLNIRSGAGSGYSIVGKLEKGNVVEVLELVSVGSNQWGRIEKGWILISGLAALNTYAEAAEPSHTHTFGDWYIHHNATCTEDGEERRACVDCDHYESRVTEATGHSYGSWYVSKEASVNEKGEERRDCDHCDHYETREVPALEQTPTVKVYATVTCYSLNIRSGAGTGYTALGQLARGTKVEVLEIVTINGIQWGKITQGWIYLTGNTTVETVEENDDTVQTDSKTYATVTCYSLNIRSGAGTGYTALGQLAQGTKVEVLEIITVNGIQWGKIAQGWIYLTGNTTVETVLE